MRRLNALYHFFAITFLFVFFLSIPNVQAQSAYKRFAINGTAQGTTFSIVYFSPDQKIQKDKIDSLLRSIDSSLSIYISYSIISRFNEGSGPIKIDAHFSRVLREAEVINKATMEIFDITIGRLTSYWGFGSKGVVDTNAKQLLAEALRCKGMSKIFLKDSVLYKSDPCIKLDVNGIAQGYSVDQIASFLYFNGVDNYIVELGGEIRVAGRRLTTNEPLKIAIEVPGKSVYERSDSLVQIILPYGAVTTSGVYKKFTEGKTRRVNHIFDARNGHSVNNNLVAVTVWAKDAITADGYDNALMVMGFKKAVRFVEKRADLAAVFFYRNRKGEIVVHPTRRFWPLIVK